MVLKEEIIKLENPIKHNEKDVNEIIVRELNFAGRLRIQSKVNPDLSDIYSQCVFPIGILESMNRVETDKYQDKIFELYKKVNSLPDNGEEKSGIDSPSDNS